MIDFKGLGYEDITIDNPIRFSECLGEFFENTHPYNKRFHKKEGAVDIELKVGTWHGMVFISAFCYYSKGWEKFELCAPEDYVNELFVQNLSAVKRKIEERIKKRYS